MADRDIVVARPTSKRGLLEQLEAMEGRYLALKSRTAGARRTAEAGAERIQSLAVSSAVSFALGAWEQSRKRTGRTAEEQALPTVAGVRPALLYGAALYLGAPLVGGRTGEVLAAGAIGCLSVAAYAIGAESQGSRGSGESTP